MELSDWFNGFQKGIAQLSTEQRVPAICARKVTSLRLYSVNAPVKVSFIPCKSFGENRNLMSRSAIPFCKAKGTVR